MCLLPVSFWDVECEYLQNREGQAFPLSTYIIHKL